MCSVSPTEKNASLLFKNEKLFVWLHRTTNLKKGQRSKSSQLRAINQVVPRFPFQNRPPTTGALFSTFFFFESDRKKNIPNRGHPFDLQHSYLKTIPRYEYFFIYFITLFLLDFGRSHSLNALNAPKPAINFTTNETKLPRLFVHQSSE